MRVACVLAVAVLVAMIASQGARAAGCARSAGSRAAPDVAITIGSGPAYAVLGFERPPPSPRGVVRLRDDERAGPYYAHKTLWAIRPGYRGPVTVTGTATDGSQRLLFSGGGSAVGGQPPERARTLRIPSVGTSDWRYYPTATLIPKPGCYRLRVQARGSVDVLVFRAVL